MSHKPLLSKDLRAGNIVNIYYAPKVYNDEKGIQAISEYGIYLISCKGDIKAKGVPLTRNIVKQFGFHCLQPKNEPQEDYVIGKLKGPIYKRDCHIFYSEVVNCFCHGNTENKIIYVHELQNLYWASTNFKKELPSDLVIINK